MSFHVAHEARVPSIYHPPSLYTGALAEVLAREAFYESMPSLRPLSYKETAQGWSRALVSKYSAKDSASFDKAQRELKEYEIDIVDVIGEVAYRRVLRQHERAVAAHKRIIETDRREVA